MRLAFIAVLAVVVIAMGASAAPQPITIATGPAAGFALPLGGEICRIVEQESQRKSRCSILATEGSVDDLERLRNGEANLAIVQSDVAAEAVASAGPFEGKPPFADLRGIAGFYPEALTILVRSDGTVKEAEDLKGKRVVVGEPSLPNTLFADYLEALGWTKSDLGGTVEMPRGDEVAALCAGTVAAVALTAPHPNGFVRSAMTAAPCPLTILDLGSSPIDTVTAAHPAYAPAVLDLGVYTGQPKLVHSFGPRAVLVTTSKLDNETVLRLMTAIDKNGDNLRKAHPAFAGLERTAMFSSRGIGAELHPAASKYLSDNKIGEQLSGE
jgi:TRAP transporter TAXI family solute receptor